MFDFIHLESKSFRVPSDLVLKKEAEWERKQYVDALENKRYSVIFNNFKVIIFQKGERTH